MSFLDCSQLFDTPESADEDLIKQLREAEDMEIPVELTDLDLWSNYTNEELYLLDKKVREFFKKTRYKRKSKNGYRTTAQVVFTWIFGRKPAPADGAICRTIHTLLKYYCTSYTGKTTFNGKPVNRVYNFTKYATNNRRPYSLRLRIEESGEHNAVFRESPDASKDKRAHGRRTDRETSNS